MAVRARERQIGSVRLSLLLVPAEGRGGLLVSAPRGLLPCQQAGGGGGHVTFADRTSLVQALGENVGTQGDFWS